MAKLERISIKEMASGLTERKVRKKGRGDQYNRLLDRRCTLQVVKRRSPKLEIFIATGNLSKCPDGKIF